MLNDVIVPTLAEASYVFGTVVMVQFVLSLLIAFNVVSYSNNFVRSIYTALSAILDPILNPIRRMLPSTGAIDFSPLVLLFVLNFTIRLLSFLGRQS